MSSPALFDPGLQPERTELAWRRTVAALTVAALVSLRVLPPVLGGWAVAVSTAGVLAGGALWVAADRRAGAVDRALRTPAPALPGGLLPLALAAAVMCAAVVAGVALLVALHGDGWRW